MDGLIEWIVYTAGMVLAGIAILAFFFNPLLALMGGAVLILVMWMLQPAASTRVELKAPDNH